MKTTDEAIFLFRKPFSSSSLIVWFYTRQNGLQKFIFRGAKKKAHHLFPMSIAELTFQTKSNNDLSFLTSAEAVIPLTFQFNPLKSSIAFFMAECTRKCVHLNHEDESLYLFLRNYIVELEVSDNLTYFPLEFLVKLSEFLGISPQIETDNSKFFDLNSGVFLTHAQNHSEMIEGEAVNLLAAVISGKSEVDYPNNVRSEALNVMILYFSLHVPTFRNIESFDIVKEILHD